jgi:hypothetical protein
LFAFEPKSRQKLRKVRDLSEAAAAALSLPHDGGEQVIHIEHEYLFATVANPAEQKARGVRTAFAVPVDIRFLDRNLVTIALRGQRELFIAVQGNHTRQSAGPTQSLSSQEHRRIEDGQHSAARADNPEDGQGRLRQNRRNPGFRSSIDLIGWDGEDSRAGLEHKQIQEFGIDGIPARACGCVCEDFRLRFSFTHLARLRCDDQNTVPG